MRPGASPILHLRSPKGITASDPRAVLDWLRRQNAQHHAARDFDDELAARIASYELAFRMQTAAPDLVDLAAETEATRRLSGIDAS